MLNRDRFQINELDTALADIRSRADALRDQVRAFQPELIANFKSVTEDFVKLKLRIEELLKEVERQELP